MKLTLNRENLIDNFKQLPKEQIELKYFKHISYEIFPVCSKISFEDDDGAIIVLKDRN